MFHYTGGNHQASVTDFGEGSLRLPSSVLPEWWRVNSDVVRVPQSSSTGAVCAEVLHWHWKHHIHFAIGYRSHWDVSGRCPEWWVLSWGGNPVRAPSTLRTFSAKEPLEGFNTLRQRQIGCLFPDNIFKCIFLNENCFILMKISLKFVAQGPINNIPALVQVMAWHRSGDKPLSEPMMACLNDAYIMTHICVTRPHWVNSLAPERCRNNFTSVFFKLILGIDILSTEICLWWVPQNPINDKSTLFQVMYWCCQATSHYLSQRWPRSMSPYGIIKPQ